MPRAKLRTPALRERVLRVAVDTLARDGVAGFTTRKIAHDAGTSVPAVYELFGDRAGLVREVFFEGFRVLGARLDTIEASDDPRADVIAVVLELRRFVLRNPMLAEVMFSSPFADFDPGPDELQAGANVREQIVGRVRRCVAAGVLTGDPVDIAHVLLALGQGLAAQEAAGWLGTTKASRDRRWRVAVAAMLDGLGTVRETA